MRNPFNRKVLNHFFLLSILMTTGAMAQSNEVVIVDSKFQNLGGIVASLPVGTPYLEAVGNDSFQNVLERALAMAPNTKIIHLFAPTDNNSISIGNGNHTLETISDGLDETVFAEQDGITLLVYSCSLANNPIGVELLQKMASKTNFNVASCASCATLDNKLNFDFSTGPLQVTSTLFE